MKLGFVACFFNPCRFTRPIENYQRFVEGLGKYKHRLTTVELVLDDDPKQLNGTEVIHVHGRRPDHFIWQKECLLNFAMLQLPKQFDAIAWLDGDVIFTDPKWVV